MHWKLIPLVLAVLVTGCASRSERESTKTIHKKEGQNGYSLFLKISRLPEAKPGDNYRDVRHNIVKTGGRIVKESKNKIVARGMLENGVEVQLDAIYRFENGLFIGHPNSIKGTIVK